MILHALATAGRLRFPLPALLAALLQAGCAEDARLVRTDLCSRVIEALNPPDARIAVLRSMPGAEPSSIRIDYRVDAAGRSRVRVVTCRFGGEGLEAGARRIASIETERGPLPESSLVLLRRFLFEAADHAPAEAERARAMHVPEVGFAAALTLQHALGGIPSVAVNALLAAAYALVYGLAGRIVLGFGEFAVLGGYAALLGLGATVAWGSPSLGLLTGLLITTFAAALHGAVAGRFIVRPLLASPGPSVLIATTGMMIALAEYVRLAQGNGFRWMPPFAVVPRALVRSGDFVATISPLVPVLGAVAAAALSGLLFAMRRTGFGRRWRAVRDDARAAELCGVDPSRVFLASFAAATGLAGVAGFMITAQFGGIGFSGGLALGLKALVGAVLGGIGSVGGAMAGGLLIGLLDAGWSAAMPLETREIAIYALLAVMLALRPGGLFGFAEGEPRKV